MSRLERYLLHRTFAAWRVIMSKIICIYLLKCVVNQKQYIGQTINLSLRAKQHQRGKIQVIDKAIQKHGWDNFNLIILHQWNLIPADPYEMTALETAWIENEQSLIQQGGYNVALFGRNILGYKHSPIAKRKMSHWHSNKTLSTEHKTNIGKTSKGRRYPNLCLGDKNPNFDHTLYSFKNQLTNEIFNGTRYDFYTKYNLNKGCVNALVNKKYKFTKNWILI